MMKVETDHKKWILAELQSWIEENQKEPGMINRVSKSFQRKINLAIPEAIHKAITAAIREMVLAVMEGSQFSNPSIKSFESFEDLESKADERILFYSRSSAIEGAITGAGGLLMGLADFPLWLSIKMKMLFELASVYGFDTKKKEERGFLLLIFQLTFSSQLNRNKIIPRILEFELQKDFIVFDRKEFNWKEFQLNYRDFLDIAKLFQLIPGVGAPVGAVINHKLTKKLGSNTKNAFRYRCLN